MKKKLTDLFLRTIDKSPKLRIEISDTVRVGLRFRMSPRGNASWIYQKKIKNGPRRGIKLGSYPSMSLLEARAAAQNFQGDAERGVDPIEKEKEAKALEIAQKLSRRTVKDILETYVTSHLNIELKAGQSRDERKRQLKTYLERYNNLPISDLTGLDLQAIIDKKQSEGKIVMGNRLRAAFRAFTGWAYRRGYLEYDIGLKLQKAGKERSRDRTPSLEEVKEIWTASLKMGPLWGPYIRLCILTGQRCRSDILKMRWSWIDFARSCYEIPNPKNGKAHIVHLSAQAVEELLDLRKQMGSKSSDFVFTTTGETTASGVSKAKRRLDKYILENWKGPFPFKPWILHDLRRAQATALAEAGFDEGVVDRIQNHVASGSNPSVVAAVYNKAQKLPERAKALDAWAKMITSEKSNIVMFQKL